jgi:hypothetical protein
MLLANRRYPNLRLRYVLLGIVLTVLISNLRAADWPQFRGINRDGISPETGLLKQWPEGGPSRLWIAEGLGEDWSSADIAQDLVYITGKLDKTGYVFCFEAALAPATPEGFKPVSSFTITKGKGKFWAHPYLSDGRLYIRHDEYLMVYDVKGL